MNCKFRDSAPLHVLHSIIKPASNKNVQMYSNAPRELLAGINGHVHCMGHTRYYFVDHYKWPSHLPCNYMSKLLFDLFTFHTFKHQFCSFHTPWHCHFLKMWTQSTCYRKVPNSKATLLGEKSITICESYHPYYVCSFDIPRMESKQVSEGPNKSDYFAETNTTANYPFFGWNVLKGLDVSNQKTQTVIWNGSWSR